MQPAENHSPWSNPVASKRLRAALSFLRSRRRFAYRSRSGAVAASCRTPIRAPIPIRAHGCIRRRIRLRAQAQAQAQAQTRITGHIPLPIQTQVRILALVPIHIHGRIRVRIPILARVPIRIQAPVPDQVPTRVGITAIGPAIGITAGIMAGTTPRPPGRRVCHGRSRHRALVLGLLAEQQPLLLCPGGRWRHDDRLLATDRLGLRHRSRSTNR